MVPCRENWCKTLVVIFTSSNLHFTSISLNARTWPFEFSVHFNANLSGFLFVSPIRHVPYHSDRLGDARELRSTSWPVKCRTSVCAILLASRLTGRWFMANAKASSNLQALPTSTSLAQTLPSDAVLDALKMILIGASLNEVLTS